MWSNTCHDDASTRQLKRILLKLRFSQSAEMDRLLYTISQKGTLPVILKNKLAKIEPFIANLEVFTQPEESAEWRRIVLDLLNQHLFSNDDGYSSGASPDCVMDETWPIPGIGRLKAEALQMPNRLYSSSGRADMPDDELFKEFRCILYRMFCQLNSPDWVYERLQKLKLEKFKIRFGFVEVLRRMEATGFVEALEKGGQAIEDFRQELIDMWNRVSRLVEGAGAVEPSGGLKPAMPEKTPAEQVGGDVILKDRKEAVVRERTLSGVTFSDVSSYHLPPPEPYVEPTVASFEPAEQHLREVTSQMVASILAEVPGSPKTRVLGSDHLMLLVESLELCIKMTNPLPADDPLHMDYLLDLVAPMLPATLWVDFLDRCGRLIYVTRMSGLKFFLMDEIKAYEAMTTQEREERQRRPLDPKLASQVAAVERAMEQIEETNYPKLPGKLEKRLEDAIEILPTLNYVKDIDGFERLLEGFLAIEDILESVWYDEALQTKTLERLIRLLPWRKEEQYRNARGKKTLRGLINFVERTLQKAKTYELPAIVTSAKQASEHAMLEHQPMQK